MQYRPRPPFLLATVLLAALVLGCANDAPPPVPRHVFFITVDTLRADHLGFYGYPRDTSPSLDALAEGSVVFERAIAQWPKTGPSFASIFTGRYPQTTGLTHKAALRVPDAYLTLPELFEEAGFTTLAVVSNGVLGKRLGWDAGFSTYRQTWDLAPALTDVPAEYRRWIEAARVNELAAPLLERHQDDARIFAWFHYSDPHAPYLLPEGEENPFGGDPHDVQEDEAVFENPRAWLLGDAAEPQRRGDYVAAYDANIRYADRRIGDLLGYARSLGLLDDALVIFTSDHGESLGEHHESDHYAAGDAGGGRHGYYGHGRVAYNPGLHVPLLISYPKGFPGGHRVLEPVELVDLFPTLRSWLTPELPVPDLEGDDLLSKLFPELGGQDGNSAPEAKATPLAFAQAGGGSPLTHWRSVQGPRYKLIYHPQLPVGERMVPQSWEIYDLVEDPGETRDLAHQDDLPAEARRLRSALFTWMNGDWITRNAEEVEAQSEETLKALRALGYM